MKSHIENTNVTEKVSLWGRFKRLPLKVRITLIAGALVFLIIAGNIISDDANDDTAPTAGGDSETEDEEADEEIEAEPASNDEEDAETVEDESITRNEDDEDEGETWQERSEQRQDDRDELIANDPIGYIEQDGPSGARDVEVYEHEGTLHISYTREVVMGDGENRLASDAHSFIETAWHAWQPEWQGLEIHALDPDAGLLWHNAGYSAGSVEYIASENTVIYETLNLRDTGETHFDRR